MKNDDSFPNGAPMAQINGETIRRLREAKGLTQLYVATAVGVTTDTISRWENRRYPSIKKENALKLAEALEVDLPSILEEPEAKEPAAAPSPAPPDEPPAGRTPSRRGPLLALSVLLIVAAAAALGWWLSQAPPALQAEAIRILPPHAPPGQPFPILIRIAASGSSSLILKEELPGSCTPLQSLPAYTSFDQEQKVIKWIGTVTSEPKLFVYLAKTTPRAAYGEQLRFTGSLVLRQDRGATFAIAGSQTLEVAPYHWADLNSDGRIDDEEILTVYDTFSPLEEMEFDRELLEDIWAAEGYRWDEAKGRYVILP